MRKLIDLEHPSFKPLWVRVAVVVVCLGWAVFELVNGNGLWAVVFGGMGLICAYRFATVDYTAIADAAKTPPNGD